MTEEQLYHLKEGDMITITAEFAGLSCFHDTVYLKLKGIYHPVSIDLILETAKKRKPIMLHSQIPQDCPLYWMTCDNCGDFTTQYDSRYQLALETMDNGWRHNATLGKHFCTLTCELEYLVKLAKKEDPQYD